jgi:hypothetical protein
MIMRLVIKHFRWHVVKSATEGAPLLLDAFCTPSEIAQFDISALVQKDVFWFQVAMKDALLVQIINSDTCLEEEDKCLILSQFPLRFQVGEKRAVLRVLQ